MKSLLLLSLFLLIAFTISAEGKRLSKSRSSSSNRGSSSSRKTGYNPAPTSGSNPQPSAPKPSLFGWQEKPAPAKQAPKSRKPNPTNTHSYPSSQTGLSGNQPKQPSTNQESVQRNNPSHSYPAQQTPVRQPQSNNPQNPSYPASNGLSGSSSSGAGYPQQHGGMSGNGAAPPAYSAGSNVHNQGPPPPYPGTGYPKQQGTGLSGSGAAAPPPYSGGSYSNNYGNSYHHPQGPPPSYGGYGGHGYNPSYSPQMPGYFGNSNYGKGGFGGVGRSSNVLTGVGIAGAGIGTVLTGLALWNLARSTGRHHHTVIYDNRGQPVAVAQDNSTKPVVPILGDLVNCTLTISNDNATEVLAIPCSIATSFTPEADVKDTGDINNANDNTKCTITVVTKAGKEFMTTIPCSVLLNTAKENNVTEPPITDNGNAPEMINGTIITPEGNVLFNQTTAFQYSIDTGIENSTLKCIPESGDIRDPINSCFSVSTNLTVIPLVFDETSLSTPTIA